MICKGFHTLLVGTVSMQLASCAAAPGKPAAPSESSAHNSTVREECAQAADQFANAESADAGAGEAGDSIEVLSISPPNGASVKKSSIIVADLAYSTKDIRSASYSVRARFDTEASNKSTGGAFVNYPQLKSAAGTVRLCFPLSAVWDLPDLKRPLTFRFSLDEADAEHPAHAVAFTERSSLAIK